MRVAHLEGGRDLWLELGRKRIDAGGRGAGRAPTSSWTCRPCLEHDAYRWICGGVAVDDHTLANFRTARGEALDGRLRDSVAALLDAGAVQLKRVAQDGMRVRARAGAASFRRGATLEEHLVLAEAQVVALKREIKEDPGAMTRRQAAARERAATAECVNALARERGLIRLRVRGRGKARCVLLWFALAHNLMRILAPAPELLGLGEVRPQRRNAQHKRP